MDYELHELLYEALANIVCKFFFWGGGSHNKIHLNISVFIFTPQSGIFILGVRLFIFRFLLPTELCPQAINPYFRFHPDNFRILSNIIFSLPLDFDEKKSTSIKKSRLRISYSRLRISYSRLRLSYFGLRSSYFGLRLSYFGLRISYSRLRSQNIRLRIGYFNSYFCPQRNAI